MPFSLSGLLSIFRKSRCFFCSAHVCMRKKKRACFNASKIDQTGSGPQTWPNNYHSQPHYDSPFLTLSALPQISKPPTFSSSVLLLSFVSFISPLPSSVNLLFLLVHCLCNDAETTPGRLSAGSPTTSIHDTPKFTLVWLESGSCK